MHLVAYPRHGIYRHMLSVPFERDITQRCIGIKNPISDQNGNCGKLKTFSRNYFNGLFHKYPFLPNALKYLNLK